MRLLGVPRPRDQRLALARCDEALERTGERSARFCRIQPTQPGGASFRTRPFEHGRAHAPKHSCARGRRRCPGVPCPPPIGIQHRLGGSPLELAVAPLQVNPIGQLIEESSCTLNEYDLECEVEARVLGVVVAQGHEGPSDCTHAVQLLLGVILFLQQRLRLLGDSFPLQGHLFFEVAI